MTTISISRFKREMRKIFRIIELNPEKVFFVTRNKIPIIVISSVNHYEQFITLQQQVRAFNE